MVVAGIGGVITVVAVAFATAAFTLLAAAWIAARRSRRAAAAALVAETRAAIAFLFDGERLQDATPAARALIGAAPAAGSDWARLAALLRHRFPGLDGAMKRLAAEGRIEIAALDGAAGDAPAAGPRAGPLDGAAATDRLVAEWHGGLARVVLADRPAREDEALPDRQSQAAAEAELAQLRAVVRALPAPVWTQGANGTVLWANDAYFALAAEVLGPDEAPSWPPPQLFPMAGGAVPEAGLAPTPFRAALRPHDGAAPRWFECAGVATGTASGIASGGVGLCHAFPADALVQAEEALREFVQTLSKTFADLPIGLAIFDRARRLALFNPALTDLTGLEVEFLAGRPTLFSFLDRLRERRRIPEPRDYRSWRQRMVEFESAAAGGAMQEKWSLPSGQTFRVSGRPHPDGAVAFLFEDITAEISLTRRFRSEIELGQLVLDSLDEAIAVFSPAGILVLSNAAYAALWRIDPAATLNETGILEATRLWQSRCAPSPLWGDARDFLADRGERADWSGRVTLEDGRSLDCRFQPLSGGATLVGFSESARSAPMRLVSRPERSRRRPPA
jgi:PAS domain-containing protein